EQQEKKENRSEEENKSFSVNQREQYGPKKTVTFTPPFSDHFPVALGSKRPPARAKGPLYTVNGRLKMATDFPTKF
ncbi:MAG TPA: hypothetical protein VNU68_33865, partial [Verrucomicrobiae bacterium]|nr:hypothetical protein [Verrucomicrobiae bacterium]